MGLHLSTGINEINQSNLRNTNAELQRKVIRLEKEIKAAINQNIEYVDKLKEELKEEKKSKNLILQKLKISEEEKTSLKTSIANHELNIINLKDDYKKLEITNSELNKDNKNLLNAIKSIDSITDKYD